MKLLARYLMMSVMLVSPMAFAANDAETVSRVYYRYINEQGNTVMNHSIPPQYIDKGYQVVSLSGEVLRVVPPALTDEAAEQAALEKAKQAKQAQTDALLRHRYSTLSDIEAIKKRSLLELQGNIDILRANLGSTRIQIENQHARAASLERNGRVVQPETLKLISDLEAEEKEIQVQIKQREHEYERESDKFDSDLVRFKELLDAEQAVATKQSEQ